LRFYEPVSLPIPMDSGSRSTDPRRLQWRGRAGFSPASQEKHRRFLLNDSRVTAIGGEGKRGEVAKGKEVTPGDYKIRSARKASE
jgi:hypothetical protein